MKILAIIFTFLLLSCNTNPVITEEKKDSILPVIQPQNSNNTALKEILKEPKVLNGIITDANVLYVQVYDDGTQRDGYASYLCDLLVEYKSTSRWVKVVKANSFNDPDRDNAYGILLGECHCE